MPIRSTTQPTSPTLHTVSQHFPGTPRFILLSNHHHLRPNTPPSPTPLLAPRPAIGRTSWTPFETPSPCGAPQIRFPALGLVGVKPNSLRKSLVSTTSRRLALISTLCIACRPLSLFLSSSDHTVLPSSVPPPRPSLSAHNLKTPSSALPTPWRRPSPAARRRGPLMLMSSIGWTSLV